MSRIVIPGGSGFLGHALAARLVDRGDEVVILSRDEGQQVEGTRTVVWDAESIGPWASELDGADAIVHLTGRRVDVRSTKRNIDELISSRVQPVRVVGEAIERCATPPRVWVQSSSLAVFGDGGDAVLDEHSTPTGIGPREMVTVCLAWEGAFHQASASVERTVLLRMGIGLGGRNDPATAKLAQLVRFGLGGRVGSGRQWVSWVGLDDLLTAMILAIDDDTMTGTYHVTSPNPVTNAEMMSTYRRLLGRRIGLPSPAWLVRIGAPILGSSASLALTGRRVVPTRLLDRGFTFEQPDFEPAARNALDACGLL
ncbi:MAG TPA: TIGR01777 family oxidoreductase [Ilumatobacteraceae bacterium]|nr:TIGR01777 family oxidoreductase [Ilumatobacteraceae bacterium]